MAGWEGLRTLSAAVVLVLLLYVAVGLTRMQEQVDLRLAASQGVAQALVSGLQARVSALEAEMSLLQNLSPPPPPWRPPPPPPPKAVCAAHSPQGSGHATQRTPGAPGAMRKAVQLYRIPQPLPLE